MTLYAASRLLPFSCEQIFDVAADVERYPEYLPGWMSARILRKEGDIAYVEQVLAMGLARVQFCSKAVLRRPDRIEVTSSESPFRHFGLTWRLMSHPAASCRLSVTVEVELRVVLLQWVANRALPASIEGVIDALQSRAHSLYANGSC